MKIFLAICLLFLMILMEEVKPTPARQKPRLKHRVKVLEESMKRLEERVQALENCKACSKINELNKTLIELKNKIDPTEPPKPDFICPTCTAMGVNPQEKCDNGLSYPVCEYKHQRQCIVYTQISAEDPENNIFTRICVDETNYQDYFKDCKTLPGCQMGRCLTSGCLATPGET